jgi:hypothetical protein
LNVARIVTNEKNRKGKMKARTNGIVLKAAVAVGIVQ